MCLESPLPHTHNLTIANCTLRGEVRTTDDLLRNGVGKVDRHGVPFRITYNGTLYAGGPAGAVTGALGLEFRWGTPLRYVFHPQPPTNKN